MQRWGLAGLIGLFFLIPTGYALWLDLEDRQTQRISQAWATVTTIAPGNSGKGPALEFLNSKGILLVGIDLSTENNKSPSYLKGVDLSGANLNGADLSGANLHEANLSGADLRRTNLSGADLRNSNLSGARLHEANLSGTNLFNAILTDARLENANLSGANLTVSNLSGADLVRANLTMAVFGNANLSEVDLSYADLSGANLQTAHHLPQEGVVRACGDENTKLPGSWRQIDIKPCIRE